MTSVLVNRRPNYILACAIFFAALMLIGSPCPSSADIYRYIDENGVMHFTNAPTSSKFKLFMRERKIFISTLDSNQFDPIIADASKKYGLEAPIKAVIKAESDFDPNAISNKGARGLMQIMPMNYRLLNVENPFDPYSKHNVYWRSPGECDPMHLLNKTDNDFRTSYYGCNAVALDRS